MPTKTTMNWLLNDICYLFIACFGWKIGVFQQTIAIVYYIIKLILILTWCWNFRNWAYFQNEQIFWKWVIRGDLLGISEVILFPHNLLECIMGVGGNFPFFWIFSFKQFAEYYTAGFGARLKILTFPDHSSRVAPSLGCSFSF